MGGEQWVCCRWKGYGMKRLCYEGIVIHMKIGKKTMSKIRELV